MSKATIPFQTNQRAAFKQVYYKREYPGNEVVTRVYRATTKSHKKK